MNTANHKYIRDVNTSLIIEEIMTGQPISRIDLADKTRLNKSTVTRIINDLLEKGLVKETGMVLKETSGRRPIKLMMNERAGYVISLEIDHRKLFGVLSDLGGTIVYEYEEDLLQSGQTLVLPQIIHLINYLKAQSDSEIVGIAIGVHGMVTETSLIKYAPYLEWKDFDLAALLKETVKEEIYINNEANFSVLGEHTFSYHYDNMIMLNIKTGIGMGIIIDKHLYNGKNGFAGEVGHMIIVPEGRPCPCGNKGCFEQYASEDAFMKRLGDISYEEYLVRLVKNDPAVLKEADKAASYLTIGLNNIINIFNPQAVIINSKFYQHLPHLIENLKDNLVSTMNIGYTIHLSRLGKRACVLGGVATVIKNYYGINYFIIHHE